MVITEDERQKLKSLLSANKIYNWEGIKVSIKDDLKSMHSKGLNKYNDVKQKIVKEIKEEIAGCEKQLVGKLCDDPPSFHWSKM